MDQKPSRRFAHTDIELMRLRMLLSPGQRLQAMFGARSVIMGMIRGRLKREFPNLSDRELNLKALEEIERAQRVASRNHSFPGYTA
jgi:hypothetical protein